MSTNLCRMSTMIMLHAHTDKCHVNMLMLHVDMNYLACIGDRSMPP